MEKDVRELISKLLARQYLPREDKLVAKALVDDTFRQDLDSRALRLTRTGARELERQLGLRLSAE